ncbi:MAG TPA: CoA pyrophosphatase [Myxococcales bacterium LLY-WYZ-16_1]|nr:CoA pyrophosphatase [Myxococcales bacterium LLY-WYZ-16_1]
MTELWTLQTVVTRLSDYRPKALESESRTRHAAVALCLRPAPDVRLLFIKRADHPSDPWSGHMAFPGGSREPQDRNLLQTAIRETREEVNVHLDGARLVTPLTPQRAPLRSRRPPLVIHPFVFEVPESTRTHPNAREVQETVWIPLSFFCEPDRLSTLEVRFGGQEHQVPCYDFDGRPIWGLTLRMLDEMLRALRP